MHFLVLIAIIPGTFQSKIYTGEDLESSLHLLDTHQQNVTPLPRGFSMLFLWGWFWFSSAGRCLLHHLPKHLPSTFWVWRLAAHRRRQSRCRRSLSRVGKQCILLPLPSKIGTEKKLSNQKKFWNYHQHTWKATMRSKRVTRMLRLYELISSRVKRVVGSRKDWYGLICGLKLILMTGAMRAN